MSALNLVGFHKAQYPRQTVEFLRCLTLGYDITQEEVGPSSHHDLKSPPPATLLDTSAFDTMSTRRDGDTGLPMWWDTELSWWMMLCVCSQSVWLEFTASPRLIRYHPSHIAHQSQGN